MTRGDSRQVPGVRPCRTIGALLALLTVAGCAAPRPFGLAPTDPPVRRGWSGPDEFAFVGVASLQPTLCWEGFPPDRERPLDPTFLADVRDVVYDLRLGRDDGTAAPRVEYSRDGVSETCYRLEEPLEPRSRYLWTVRARFTVRGEPRMTEWGVTDEALRWRVSPLSPHSYRFQTPGKGE